MAWKRNEPEPTPSPSPAASKPSQPQTAARGERAVIGSSITVQGDVRGEEDLTVLGRVQGTIDVKGNSITVGQGGRVEADLHAKLIVVEGRVEGNLFGGDQIILRSAADVQGNLTAPRVALDDGAQFKGAIDMEPESKSRSGGPSGPGGSTGSGESKRTGGPSGPDSSSRATSDKPSGETKVGGAGKDSPSPPRKDG